MEGLALNSIPRILLARVLLQLHVIPQHYFDNLGEESYRILVAGLQKYGETSDLGGLLKFCLCEAEEFIHRTGGKQIEWWWKDFSVSRESDWDRLDLAYPITKSEPVNLHVEILAEEARKGAVDIKYAKEASALKDKRLVYSHEDASIPIDSILYGTLTYLGKTQQTSTEEPVTATLTHLIEKRLEKFARERYEQKQQEQRVTSTSEAHANSDYILMGALMRPRLCETYTDNGMINKGKEQQQWCLYLRDYVSSEAGTIWRIVSESTTPEIQVSASQALADIRGVPTPADDHGKSILLPNEWSRNYQPVYLFYCNSDLVTRSLCNSAAAAAAAGPNALGEEDREAYDTSGVITYDDYLFDEDMPDYAVQDEEDDDVCKVCGIPDIVKDINNIFLCDKCNQGVHQLCSNPPIENFELDLTPWYCRECSHANGLPLPQRQIGLSSSSSSSNSNNDKENDLPDNVLVSNENEKNESFPASASACTHTTNTHSKKETHKYTPSFNRIAFLGGLV